MVKRASLFYNSQDNSEKKQCVQCIRILGDMGSLGSTGEPQGYFGEQDVSLFNHPRILTQVVDPQVGFKAICCLGIRTHHHACVVDQNMEVLLLC
jgi:hypothetical protein